MRMMKALYANVSDAKMEGEIMQLALAMKNPVWLGCAVTNRPHIRLKEHPLSVTEIGGKKFIRVPMMRTGLYAHPQGDLDMTGLILDQFILNHDKGVGDFEVVLDPKHLPDHGAIALFEKKHGGFVQREKGDKPGIADPTGELLVAYGIPTGDDSVALIENGKFRHASMEFHPDYKSNLKQTYLSSDDLEEKEEANMTVKLTMKKVFGKLVNVKPKFGAKKTTNTPAKTSIKKKKYGKFPPAKKMKKLEITLTSLAPVYELLSEYTEKGKDEEFVWFDSDQYDFSEFDLPVQQGYYKVDKQTAEEMLAALDEMAQEPEFQNLFEESEEDMPDEVETVEESTELQLKLEAANQRILALEKQGAEDRVKAVIAEARTYTDSNGMGHSAVLLNLVHDLMLGNPLENETIKLEDMTNPAAIANYFRSGLAHLLKTIPGQVKVKSETVPEQTRTLEAGTNGSLFETGKKDASSFWSVM